MSVRILLALSAAVLCACTTQTPTVFSFNEACSTSPPSYESREVQCKFPKTAFGRKFRFKANFSGGHDDTVARIEPFIDNSAVNCDGGSKTYLSSEDGDVSLWCIFSMDDKAQNEGIFKATIRWSHAEYVNYEIAAE